MRWDGSNNPSNWHTAAESFGFGTPGKENSQFVPYAAAGEFSFPNKVFSPDNDGHEDVLQIRYEMNENGLLGSIQIYDANGRLVRKLKESELLGTNGVFTWDGVNDEGTKASIGQYIVVFEAFQPNGGTTFADRKCAFWQVSYKVFEGKMLAPGSKGWINKYLELHSKKSSM